MGEVLFILRYGGLRIHAVVPTLIPDEAGELDLRAVVCREILLQIGQRLTHLGDHLRVIRTDLTAGARRTEIAIEALASPGGLDEQHLVAVGLTDDVSELIFGTEVMLAHVRTEAEGERTRLQGLSLALITHPDIVPDRPRSIRLLQVGVTSASLGLGHHVQQSAFALVVITSRQVSDALPLHVGLPGEDEDLEFPDRLGGEAQDGPAEQDRGESHKPLILLTLPPRKPIPSDNTSLP